MKAKELLIDNYYLRKGEVFQMDSHELLKILDSGGEYNYEPIPLTEDWLEKFGFHKEGGENYNWFLEDFTLEVFGTKLPIEQREYRFRRYGNETKVLFVHQLQNLIYCLTNQNLKISI